MKAALYVRVSTNKQDADNQISVLREYCKKTGWDIYREYVDITTGSKDSRPDWDIMFKEAHQRLYDVVLFWSFDRFSRSGTSYTLQKLHELELLNIGYRSYQELYIDSIGMFRDVVISILATIAKAERERISERTKAGIPCFCGHKRAMHDNEGCKKCECKKFTGTSKRGKDTKPRKPRSDRGTSRKAGSNNYIETTNGKKEHRIIMEKHIGRCLTPDEVVHHINGNIKDNRIENLQLFPNKSKHTKFHELKRGVQKKP